MIGWCFHLAGVEGIEPSSGVLETLILPMNYTPIITQRVYNIVYILSIVFFKRCLIFFPVGRIFSNSIQSKKVDIINSYFDKRFEIDLGYESTEEEFIKTKDNICTQPHQYINLILG